MAKLNTNGQHYTIFVSFGKQRLLRELEGKAELPRNVAVTGFEKCLIFATEAFSSYFFTFFCKTDFSHFIDSLQWRHTQKHMAINGVEIFNTETGLNQAVYLSPL